MSRAASALHATKPEPALKRLMHRLSDPLLLLLVECWGWVRHFRIMRQYFRRAYPHGHFPRLATPRSANDKFLWRKLFDHDPRFVMACDKLRCKEWVHAHGLDLGIAPVLWVGTDPAQIPASLLQQDVAIKATGGSRTNLFVREGAYEQDELVRIARRWLKAPYGWPWYEWGYFGVPRTLFVESMIRPGNGTLDELKLYTFGERIERVVHIIDRFDDIAASVWEPGEHGKLVRSTRPAAVAERIAQAPLPPTIGRAMEYARVLGRPFDHMRVDLYTDGEQLWFGELTVYNQSGLISGVGHDPHSRISRSWDIRRSNFLRHPPRRGWRAWYAAALSRWLERRT